MRVPVQLDRGRWQLAALAPWLRRRGLAVGIVAGGGAAGYFVLLP